MATVFKPKYIVAQLIVVLLKNLTDGSIATSVQISNTTDLYLDVLVQLSVKTGSGVDTDNGVIRVFVIASVDGGVTYPDVSNDELIPIGVFNANVDTTTFKSPPMSVANAFGGKLPEKYKIVVKNDTGANLDNVDEAVHLKQYQGIQGQYS